MSSAPSTSTSRPEPGDHRGVRFLMGGAIIALLGAAAILLQLYRAANVREPELAARERADRLRVARAFDALAQIQDSLGLIASRSATRRLRALASTEDEIGHSGTALEYIAEIRSIIQRDQERIAQLESSLERSEARASRSDRRLKGLELTLARRQTQVRSLKAQVNTLNARVAGLQSDVENGQETIRRREQTIEARRREIGTVYYMTGTKRALADSGVIESAGGVLGLGKVLRVSNHLDNQAFTPIDTDHDHTISIPARKARVVSAQPAASYELRPRGGGLVLYIVDPLRFRAIKHVVIVTD